MFLDDGDYNIHHPQQKCIAKRISGEIKKNDLSDDGEDDYTGRDIKADNKHRSADSGVDAVLCVD